MTDRVAQPARAPILKLVGGHLLLERPDATVRLLLFHHAGGSAMSFVPLARAMPTMCEPVLFELGGRGNRSGEPYPDAFTAAVCQLLPDVLRLLDRPTVVVGHSLGALLAHSIVVSLPPERHRWLRAVVVSASKSPVTAAQLASWPESPFQVRSPESLLADLRRFGGLPAGLLEDPDIRDHAVRVVGHDLHLADTYVRPPVVDHPVPYHFWYGAADAYVDAAEGRLWAESTGQQVSEQRFRGGHFFLVEQEAPREALERLVVEAGSRTAKP